MPTTSSSRRISLATAALLLGAGAPALSAQDLPVQREFRVASGQLLDLDLQTGGGIRVVGGAGEVVRVRAEESGRGCDDCRVELEQTASGVRLRAYDPSRGRRNRSGDVRVEVEVPQRFDLRLVTMGGEIEIENVTGEIHGKTMGGALELSRLGGNIDLTTMGGTVRLSDSNVNGKVHSMGGSVLLEDVTGDVRGSSMGGAVTRRGRGQGGGAAGGGEVRIHTMGGEIAVDEAPAGADVHTMGGDIRVRSAASHVRAKTMGGTIVLEAVDGSVRATTMGGDVSVRMVGDPARGDRAVEITSMGGDVDLVVPAALSMAVDIELDYTRGHEGDYSITSDFPLQQRVSGEWERDGGDARKTITATGSIAGGQHPVRIRTINGNVKLRRGS